MKRPIKYRESLRKGIKRGKFGIWIWETRKGSTEWDNKRFLFPDGSTRAWKNVGEYLDFKTKSRKIIKDELSEKFMDLKGDENYE